MYKLSVRKVVQATRSSRFGSEKHFHRGHVRILLQAQKRTYTCYKGFNVTYHSPHRIPLEPRVRFLCSWKGGNRDEDISQNSESTSDESKLADIYSGGLSKDSDVRSDSVMCFLDLYGLTYEEVEPDNFLIERCPFCHDIKDDPTNMNKNTIATNYQHSDGSSGIVFNCFRCSASGGWAKFARHVCEENGHHLPQTKSKSTSQDKGLPRSDASFAVDPMQDTSVVSSGAYLGRNFARNESPTVGVPQPPPTSIISSTRANGEQAKRPSALVVAPAPAPPPLPLLTKASPTATSSDSVLPDEDDDGEVIISLREKENKSKEKARTSRSREGVSTRKQKRLTRRITDQEFAEYEAQLLSAFYADAVKDIYETRGIRKDILSFYRVGMSKFGFRNPKNDSKTSYIKTGCITFPFCPTWDGPPLAAKVRSLENKANQQVIFGDDGHGCKPEIGLIGWHTVAPEDKRIVITEGEFDAFAVYQDTGVPAVSLPLGANSPINNTIMDELEEIEEIVLWLDNDEVGRDAVERLLPIFGRDRCVVVRTDSDVKDANEALLKGLNLQTYIDAAVAMAGPQIATLPEMRSLVETYLLHPPDNGVPYTSMPGLTKYLKGHRKGELTVFTGPTGSGKTTLLSQISIDLAMQGVKTLWGSFEIKNERLITSMLQQYNGRDSSLGMLSPSNVALSHEELLKSLDDFCEMPLFFMRYFGATEVEDVLTSMHAAFEAHRVDHVIIDNLQFMMSDRKGERRFASSSFDRFEEMDYAISQFRLFASRHDVHVTLVIHPRKEPEGDSLSISSFYGTSKATQEADNVLILQKSREGSRSIDIKKNRFDGETGKVPLEFSPANRLFIDSSPEAALLRNYDEGAGMEV